MKHPETSKSTHLNPQPNRFWKKCKRESYLTSYDSKQVFRNFYFLGSSKDHKFCNIKNLEVSKYMLTNTFYLFTFTFQTLVLSDALYLIDKLSFSLKKIIREDGPEP